jgi:predicted Zn-dependent protease
MTRLAVIFIAISSLIGCETVQQIDSALYSGMDKISTVDKVTGIRSLNLKSDEQSFAAGSATFDKLMEAVAKEDGRTLPENDPTYIRVKRIYDRVIAVSHFKDAEGLKFAVIDDPMFNAFAFGGGHSVVIKGLADGTTDDELAYVIGHELAHNAASHVEEADAITKTRKVLSKDTGYGYTTVHTNIAEQEADRIGIVYASLAGFDPIGSVTVWSKKATNDPNRFNYYRSHPENGERAYLNAQTVAKAKQYYTRGQVNSDFEQLLVCNEVYCNRQREEIEAGEGGGSLRLFETVADTYIKNMQTKAEKARQEEQIVQSQQVALAAPRVQWPAVYQVYEGQVELGGQLTGASVGFAGPVGDMYYTANGQTLRVRLQYQYAQNGVSIYKWTDLRGSGLIGFANRTDGSVAGAFLMQDNARRLQPAGGGFYGMPKR